MLRFDSLSKILSSGIRIGFASGPEALLQALDMHVRAYPLLRRLVLMHITVSIDRRREFADSLAHTSDRIFNPECMGL